MRPRQIALVFAAGGFVDPFKIKLARIELVKPAEAGEIEAGEGVCLTFEFERAPNSFQVPICLPRRDFDDTEVVKVARNALHVIFAQLAEQCEDWHLTDAELQELSNMNLRPQ
jgi:hypothetical protein